MKTVTEQLEFRKAIYPQLKKLPKGTRFVKQLGFPEIKSILKYCAYSINGTLIGINLGNSLKAARKNALNELNTKMRHENLVWGNKCRKENYLNAIN